MGRIGRYLFRNLFVATLFTTLAVTAAIWVTQSVRLIDLVINAGAPFYVFIQLILVTVPTFLGIIMPIALASAVVFTYNRMTMDSELVVMRASGASPLALAVPALVLALLVTICVYGLNLYGSPYANRELVRLQYAVRHDYASVLIREGAFNVLADGLTVYLRDRSEGGDLLGVVVHDQRAADKVITLMAKRGLMAETAQGMRLVLEGGLRQEFEPRSGRFSELYFDRYALELQLFRESQAERWSEARERPLEELLNPPEDVRRVPQAYRQFVAELHSRLSTPLLALAFTILVLACLLVGEYNRRGQGLRLAVAGLLVLALQGASLGLTGLANNNLLFVPAMYVLYLLPIVPAFWLLVRR